MNEYWFPSRIVELSQEECLELLGAVPVGRVAYCNSSGAVVLPVNHVVSHGCVLFRTSPHSELGRQLLRGPHLAASYQVDSFDAYTQFGWSVLMQGTAERVEHDSPPVPDQRPAPWVEGIRCLSVRIQCVSLTGRRLLPT